MSGFNGAADGGNVKKSDIVNNLTSGSSSPLSSGGAYDAIKSVSNQIVYGTYCYVYKKAGVVYMCGHSAGDLTLTADANWHSLTTLPEGYRPIDDVYFSGASVSGKGISLHVLPSGLVEYVCGIGNSTSYWNYSVSFISQ